MNAVQQLAGIAALGLAAPCMAHHSMAMFDMAKTITLHGTVKEFQWTNPHCFIQLLVPDQSGTTEWSIEMNSPLASYRLGFKPGTLKPGDTVTLVIHPVKAGTPGGELVSATAANGQPLAKPKPQT
ncbi:MAG: DUF6152 family protein [Steroidobacteraceae bacterium]